MLKTVVAMAMKTITSTHQGMRGSDGSGPGLATGAGAGVGLTSVGVGVTSVSTSTVSGGFSGTTYFTVPIACSRGRNSVTGSQKMTLALASVSTPMMV